jgi:Flp pilus assembly protein TadG
LPLAGSRLRGGGERGALILSYLIIVPVFMAALMVIVQGSLWYLAREAALAAARQGADAARVLHAPPGAGPRAALAFARSSASGFLLHPRAFGNGSTATTVQITVTGRVPSIVPGLPIAVTQVARVPVEQFTTP